MEERRAEWRLLIPGFCPESFKSKNVKILSRPGINRFTPADKPGASFTVCGKVWKNISDLCPAVDRLWPPPDSNDEDKENENKV